MRWSFACAIVAGLASACSSQRHFQKTLRAAESEFKDHIGFVLFDPADSKTLVEYNSHTYFTPASNTKLFTFYTSLLLLGDSIPGIRYTERGDSVIVWGTGDPSFLYSNVSSTDKVFRFLNNARGRLFLSTENFKTTFFGPAWAWDDYFFYYSAERSPFPIYGNLMKVWKSEAGVWQTQPRMFMSSISRGDSTHGQTQVVRDIGSNRLTVAPGRKTSTRNVWSIPFHYDHNVLTQILADTLHREVELCQLALPHDASAINSVRADSLYKVMLQESDNFIAEQLLLQCAGVVSDTLDPEVAIRYSTKNFLAGMPDRPQWVDGSGLSRFNLVTPGSIAWLLDRIYLKVPRERLFHLLPAGGVNGTIRTWYKGEEPFVFAKTGSLSNNHSLSGYVLTKKGKVLIFSFMNSNFIEPSSSVKQLMQKILNEIREKY